MLEIVDPYDRNLDLHTRASFLSVHDLLMRRPNPNRDEPFEEVEKTRILVESGHPEGYISYRLYEIIVFMEENTGHEHLALASLLTFPVTNNFSPRIWDFLIEVALKELRQLGSRAVYIYIPIRCHRHRKYLQEKEFTKIGFCDNKSYLAELGFDETCVIFAKIFDKPKDVPDIYPYLSDSFIQLRADVRDAPLSSIEHWGKAYLYSGYSGYPFFRNFLSIVLDENVRSILSIPCATGDVLRFLPYENLPSLQSVIGVDVTPHLVKFAKARLINPQIDILNRFLCWLFYNDVSGYRSSAFTQSALDAILEALGVRCNDHQRLHLYAQMRAMFRRGVVSGAIADWFCLSKGFAEFVVPGSTEGVFQKVVTIVEELGKQTILDLIRDHDASFLLEQDEMSVDLCEQYFDEGRSRLVCQDMYELNLGQRFDTILVWEAALMVVADNRQEQFVSMLERHLNPKGCLVITGLRTDKPSSPYELQTLARHLAGLGFSISTTNMRFQPVRWAFRPIQENWAPILIAKL